MPNEFVGEIFCLKRRRQISVTNFFCALRQHVSNFSVCQVVALDTAKTYFPFMGDIFFFIQAVFLNKRILINATSCLLVRVFVFSTIWVMSGLGAA